jgi:hypothetical protein
MSIFGTIMAITVSVFLSITMQTQDNLGRADSVQNARMGLMQFDRMARSGNLFKPPTDEGMRVLVFTQANGARQCVEWRVDSGELQTRSWPPDWRLHSGSVSIWATTARNLVNTAPGYPEVKAFDLISAGNSQAVLRVDLRVKNPHDRGEPTAVTGSVSGRNTLFGYDPNICDDQPPD